MPTRQGRRVRRPGDRSPRRWGLRPPWHAGRHAERSGRDARGRQVAIRLPPRPSGSCRRLPAPAARAVLAALQRPWRRAWWGSWSAEGSCSGAAGRDERPAGEPAETVTIRLRHTEGGPAVGVESLSARLTSDGADLGEIPLSFVAEGEYASEVVLPAPGTWRLQVSVRRSEFVNPVTTLDFPVASR